MNLTRRGLLSLAGIVGLSACRRSRTTEEPHEDAPETTEVPEEQPEEPEVDLHEFDGLLIDADAWHYDDVNDCYYQLGLPYCLTPGSEQYETFAVFVPGAYFQATKHGNTYSCVVDEEATVGDFTPRTAPVAMPINSSQGNAQECPATYSFEGLGRYLRAGFVYVYAGFRGRSGGYESTTQEYFSGGAPWPVVDLKAAVRCLRLNAGLLPCDTKRVFLFGQGVGGGMGALLGVSGDCSLYDPYLAEVGAATHDGEGKDLSDAIHGMAAWCPLLAYDSADAAYEWMMGQYSEEGSRKNGTWTRLLSDDLAEAYGTYINDLGLVDAEGNSLTLDRIENGSYTGGSYYDYLVGLVEDAAEDFLDRTEFPYTAVPILASERSFPGDPMLKSGVVAEDSGKKSDEEDATVAGVRQIEATVYDTLESYITTLNGPSRWLTYNSNTGKVDVTGLWGFVRTCRLPSKDVCAYDQIDRSGLANQLFGTDELPSLHFDPMIADLIEKKHDTYAEAKHWDEELVSEWRGDLVETDALDHTVRERVELSDPLALLAGLPMPVADDAEDSEDVELADVEVAPYWRLSTGLWQSETTFASEANLALALAATEGVQDVDFQTVWAAGYELAERSGDPEDQLVAWICDCCAADGSQGEQEPEDSGSDEAAEEEMGEE